MKRVFTSRGKVPLMVVAPHGHKDDDINTDIIAEVIAKKMNAYYVINTGWKRSEKANLGENLANLNNIRHCKLGACKREFLDPFLSYKDDAINRFGGLFILHVHGMSNKIRHKTKDCVDIVAGYGSGDPPSYSCDIEYKNRLVFFLKEENFNVYQGKAGGKFSAWKPENLNQFFRQWIIDQRIHSIQLEIVNLRRYCRQVAVETALTITKVLDRFLYSRKTKLPQVDVMEF